MNEEMFMQYRYLGFVNDLEDDMQFYWEVSFGSYYGSIARSYSIKVFTYLFSLLSSIPITRTSV